MRTALVVEDDDDIRMLLRVILTQDDYSVTVVENGQAGIDAALSLRPDLCVVDVGLPDMEGYQVVTELTGIVAGHIVMLSARSTEDDARKGLEAGADDYLTKPFRPRMLREQLQAIVARPARAAAESDVPAVDAESEAS
ncbi:response regulator transcription factor [Brachybacterium sp. J153]|uniref:response regulator transcription factor n=1 Tax=Brachybacterium sp. J153 TaxID=3116488 RepID=UPI002E780FCD|nr:response regulator [Brachybacterium sp. J153]MEE1617863.1 response regulator [Brachybacterium sp. J153]